MSAIPIRQEAPKPRILKLFNTTYTLDPYHDRLVSQGYDVLEATSYADAVELAHNTFPELVLVYDDPEAGIDAVRWIELQHGDRFGWMATTPLLILADSGRIPVLKIEELPDRIVLLQRRSDTLNQLTRMVKWLLSVWQVG